MRVFVTGATGFAGSAVVQELLSAGHGVLGLVRSESSAAALAKAGADVHRGSIDDLDSLRSGAAQSDAVIHTAFDHDFSKFADNCRRDQIAIETLGAALSGSARPLVVTSGLALGVSGRDATEEDPAMLPYELMPRVSEATALGLARQGVCASVVRLPPTTHGAGDHGFVPILIDIARRTGRTAYVGEGLNRWSAVHRFDAAVVYRRAIETAKAGARYHAIAETGIAFKDIAHAIGEHLNVPVVSLSPEEAAAHFTWFAKFASMNLSATSVHTREALGWSPKQPTLAQDLAQAGYFAS
ncbi:SDR family oxidoreductase [Piscinibacter terrae]|uniref:NAD-dependent epimerase/dehydratase family protein n=1 Tax=Piscinibacter terrae TaxID=2496871 RepID=A0A3N7HS55_9BURK|nr:SDR family oxidoreductase [Albitalea terrae]RQP25118.1 NAD-dependent epimerase/dehydratase family protein [Albitalea terrae]